MFQPRSLALCFAPGCQQKGKSVQVITLKALLTPSALETIDPQSPYAFCSNPSCEVVYFSDRQRFNKDVVKVPVFQKDVVLDVPVCYCFGWTRERLMRALQEKEQPNKHISEHVQANRVRHRLNSGVCVSLEKGTIRDICPEVTRGDHV